MTFDSQAEIERMASLYGEPRNESPVDGLRTPPQSAEAEQAVLGGLMLSNNALPKVQDWLSPEDFYRDVHSRIYRGILALSEKRKPFDAVTLGEWIEAQGWLPDIGGGGYLFELTKSTASAANITAYAEIIRDKATLRRVIEIGTGAVNSAFQPEGRDTREVVAELQQAASGLIGERITGAKTMKQVSRAWFDELQRRYQDDGGLLGLPTPWAGFNEMTAGLQAGHLVVVAGRPSMGKSAWAVNVATANALSGKRVLFFNLEMTDVSIYNRGIASIMDVPLSWLRQPDKEQDHYWNRVTEGVRRMNDSGLLIDDTPGLRREQILARARREHMRAPLDMVIVDHLHLMPLPGKTRETVEIGEITRDLKGLAKELDCPVVLLSQLNRGLESRPNKRPQMADLRESGNIEQDADIIVFLYRDDYYADRESRGSEYPGFVEIIIAKQREGETGKVWARDRLAFGLLDDYDGPSPDPVVSDAPAKRTRGMPMMNRGRERASGEGA